MFVPRLCEINFLSNNPRLYRNIHAGFVAVAIQSMVPVKRNKLRYNPSMEIIRELLCLKASS